MNAKYKKIIIIVVVAFLGLAFLKDALIKSAITSIGSNILGAKIEIKSFSLSFLTQKARVKGFKIYNPKGFPKESFIDIPEVLVDVNAWGLLSGKVHIQEMVLNLHEIVLVNSIDGALNVESLKIVQEQKQKEAKKGEAKEKEITKKEKKKAKPVFQIDLVKLNMDRVVQKKMKETKYPQVLVYNVNHQNKEFKNITSPEELTFKIMLEALGPAGIKSAAIYAAATVLNVAIPVAGIVGLFLGDDDISTSYSVSQKKAYETSLRLLNELGDVIQENPSAGMIKAKVNGHDVVISFTSEDNRNTKVLVTARQVLMPKAAFAGGIAYHIEKELQ